MEAIERVLPLGCCGERCRLRGAGLRRVRGAIEAVAQGKQVAFVGVDVDAVGEQQVAQGRGRRGIDDVTVEGCCAVGCGGKDAGAGLKCSVLIAELEGGKAEGLVLAERSTNGTTYLFPIEARYRLRAVEGGGQTLQMAVALEDKGGPVDLIATGACNDVDDAVAGATDFGGEARGGDLELGDGVFREV